MKILMLLIMLVLTPAIAEATVCSTVGSIPTAIHYGDTITADVQGCSALPTIPGPKRFTFWPRYDPYLSSSIETGDLGVGCPAGTWPGTIKRLIWTTYRATTHPVIDLQWSYIYGGVSTPFEPNIVNNGCKVWFSLARPTTNPCDPMTVCSGNTVMFCQSLNGAPAVASSCISGPFGMVIPPSVGGTCNCTTVILRIALSDFTKQLYRDAQTTFASASTMLYAMTTLQWPPFMFITTRTFARGTTAAAVAAGFMADDPPDLVNATVLPNVQDYLEAPTVLTTADGCTATQCAALNTAMAKLNQAQAKMRAAQAALDRWAGCAQLNCDAWLLDQQLDYYDQTIAGAQVALGLLAQSTATFNDQATWGAQNGVKNLRPGLRPMTDLTATFSALSTAGLASE